jgi:hypothetical protein
VQIRSFYQQDLESLVNNLYQTRSDALENSVIHTCNQFLILKDDGFIIHFMCILYFSFLISLVLKLSTADMLFHKIASSTTHKVSKARTPYIFTNAFQVTTRQEAEQEDQTNWNNWIPIWKQYERSLQSFAVAKGEPKIEGTNPKTTWHAWQLHFCWVQFVFLPK